jgi:hypothetical protein
MATLQLVTVSTDDLSQIVREAVAYALTSERTQQAQDCAGLSLNGAARLARRRRDYVSKALESGGLIGKRYGSSKTKPRWSIIAADVRAWLAAGCPLTAEVAWAASQSKEA